MRNILNPFTGKLQKVVNNMGDLTDHPIFSVHKDGNNQGGIVTDTFTKMTWTTELFDTSSEFNLTDNQFEATWNGYLLLNVNALYTSPVVDKQLRLIPYKDGSAMSYVSYGQTNAFTQAGVQGTFIIPVVSGSNYSMYTRHNFGVNGTISGIFNVTYFQGFRLG